MRFLLDENVDIQIGALLTEAGHEVASVGREHPSALGDLEILRIASDERRILLTNDTDFGELIVRRGARHAGVVLFRLSDEALQAKWARLQGVLQDFADQLDGFIVIGDAGNRVRRREGA